MSLRTASAAYVKAHKSGLKAGSKLLGGTFITSAIAAVVAAVHSGITLASGLGWSAIIGGGTAVATIVEEWLNPKRTNFGIGSKKGTP